MKHAGVKPAAQPRSLRSIAEAGNAGGDFPDDAAYDTNAGVPEGTPGLGAGQKYDDVAKTAMPASQTQSTINQPNPFGGKR